MEDVANWHDKPYTYQWLLDELDRAGEELTRLDVSLGSVVSLEPDYSPNAIATMLSLLERNCIVVPLTESVQDQKAEYGTEPMPQNTLRRFHELFPNVRLQQTYGTFEVGILRSKSKSSDSLWVKVGGEGLETRVVGGSWRSRPDRRCSAI